MINSFPQYLCMHDSNLHVIEAAHVTGWLFYFTYNIVAIF